MNQQHVLLLETDSELVAHLTEALSARGYAVHAATTQEFALAGAALRAEVALVDLDTSDCHAASLVPRLKQLLPDCEVVVLTRSASVESAAAAVRAGAWAYLVEPTPAGVLATLEQALEYLRDQSNRRESARRAQVADKLAAFGTLTAGLSHEIRNPLNSASLQLMVLERRLKKLEPRVQAPLLDTLAVVRDELRRLHLVLDDFLGFGALPPVAPVLVPLHPVLEGVVTTLSGDAGRRGLKLEMTCARESVTRSDEPRCGKTCRSWLTCTREPVVRGDEVQLRQVFTNLCMAALDASPTGGSVAISWSTHNGQLVVHVDDQGPRLTGDHQRAIFEPIFHHTQAGTTGLGLPINNAIITRHGGAIEIGTSPSGGSRVSVKLPTA